jgi:hypothetical protein
MHSVSKDRADIAAADRQSAPRPYAEPRAVVARTVAEQPAQRRESQAADASVGHLSLSPPYGPMDFAGWFEAFLSGRWYTFDPRNNTPRMGRGLIALGVMLLTCYHAHLRSQYACQLQGVDGRGQLVLSAPLRPDD